MEIKDVKKRKSYLEYSKYNKNDINIDILINKSKNGITPYMIKLLKNYNQLNSIEEFAVSETMNILKEYLNNCNNESDKQKVLLYIKESFIPSISNLEKSKNSINRFMESTDIKYDLIGECDKYIHCDRVLKNYDKLDRIININNIIQENNINEYNIDENIYNICNKINKFNMRNDIKYNAALESILYGFEKNGIEYNKQDILESITDYFLHNLDENLNIIEKVLSKTPLYIITENFISKTILEKNKVLFDTNKTLNNIEKVTLSGIKKILDKLYAQSIDQIINEIPNFFTWIRKALVFSTLAITPFIGIPTIMIDRFIEMSIKRKHTKKILKTFRRERTRIEKTLYSTKDKELKQKYKKYLEELEKSINKLETYEEDLYTDEENSKRMLESNIDLKNGFETTFNDFINTNTKRIPIKDYLEFHHLRTIDNLEKTVKRYLDLLMSKYKKLYDCKVLLPTEELEIKEFENSDINTIYKYLNNYNLMVEIGCCLPRNYNNIIESVNINDILSNLCKELNTVSKDEYYIIYDGNNDMNRIYFVFKTPIIYSNIDTNIHKSLEKDIKYIFMVSECVNKILNEYNSDSILKMINSDIQNYDKDIIDSITQFGLVYQNIIDIDKLNQIYTESKNNVYKNINNKSKYKISSVLSENIYELSNRKVNKIYKIDYEILSELTNYIEICNSINEIHECISNKDLVLETSFLNTLKMAKEKMKKSVKNLSDKEKSISNQLDSSIENYIRKVEISKSTKNREAVIKGSVIPSASKIIKLILTTGALAFIDPALAIIGSLGYIGSSVLTKRKEKQMILDEIEIELKMTEKKMQLAESNGDMKSLHQLMRAEKKLKREKQRILYNLKAYYSDNSNND